MKRWVVVLGAVAASGCGAGYARCVSDAQCPAESRCDVATLLCVTLPEPPTAECNATSCPNGCCAAGVCVLRTEQTCGPIGGACVACDPASADTCSGGGACRCGAGPACGVGQSCSGGLCTGGACDARSCPSGCCRAGVCTTPSIQECGSAGSACSACDGATADGCTADGSCGCGTGLACAGNLRCVNGACTPTACSPATCPNGCCSGGACLPRSVAACGAGGTACAACDPNAADSCSAAGACGCGTGPACGPGLRCAGGQCAPVGCTAINCPDGCCDGNVCKVRSVVSCGTAGATCAACTVLEADNCSSGGACRCGAQPPCAGSSTCIGGNCVAAACGPLTCPNGCCKDGQCQVPTKDRCGRGGGACVNCNDGKVGDNCGPAGTCRCGMGAPCTGSKECKGGMCK